MDILIIEDEILAAERLQALIKKYDCTINIAGCLESIEDSVKWLQRKWVQHHPHYQNNNSGN